MTQSCMSDDDKNNQKYKVPTNQQIQSLDKESIIQQDDLDFFDSKLRNEQKKLFKKVYRKSHSAVKKSGKYLKGGELISIVEIFNHFSQKNDTNQKV